MPAKSKAQQRFFGVVEAYLKGRIKNPSEDVVRAAESMSADDIRHFAATKHEGLQEKKSQAITILTSAYLLSRHHNKKKKNEEQKSEKKKELDVEFFDGEKKAWQKTPVHIQNREVAYDFESLEEAAAFLASMGVLSDDEVLSLLSGRAGMINGFAISYPGEKVAQHVVLVDPGRRMSMRMRANKIFNEINKPDDDEDRKSQEARLNKEVEDNKKTVDSLAKAVVELASLLS